MELNYRILWFEDTEESFSSLSRLTKRYVTKKMLYCTIDRIWGLSDFDMSIYDINSYDLLVVDLKLSNGSKGFEVIKRIRDSGFVNDILFYSSAGVSDLKEALSEYELEGVFLSEREARIFMDNIKKLIDKSVRRSENVINIRGIVMDETSKYDNQMAELALGLIMKLGKDDEIRIQRYIKEELLANQKKTIERLMGKYAIGEKWDYADLFSTPTFSSYMMARLIGKVLNVNENSFIEAIVKSCITQMPKLSESGKIEFAKNYDRDILYFRNKLAHVKTLDSDYPPLICERDGHEYRCDEAFCTMMRESLIEYGSLFNKMSEVAEKDNNTEE